MFALCCQTKISAPNMAVLRLFTPNGSANISAEGVVFFKII